jgi:hypothetical protein
MAYEKFNQGNVDKRFEDLPHILSGPILRRVSADSVTVWVALKQQYGTLSLSIIDGDNTLFTSAPSAPAKIGEHLFVLAVTAKAPPGRLLSRSKIYQYNLNFHSGDNFSSGDNLKTPGIYSTDGGKDLCYGNYGLPTFVIPPEKWQDLHFLHGSCRKIHGEGIDALSIANAVIEQSAADSLVRPQFLMMTGDQIYADDVADSVLFMLQDVGSTVLGWTDKLPGLDGENLNPGHRADVAVDKLFFTTDRQGAQNHLFHFYEFCAMYLMVWSDVLWPKTEEEFPVYKDVFGLIGKDKEKTAYAEQRKHVVKFRQTLPLVRKVMANIPCYMICDDHEVTDDWYISVNWCAKVLGNDTGRRVIQNALAGYAIFQAWGNTPEQFEGEDSPGYKFLKEIGKSTSSNPGLLDWFLNIPPKDQIFNPSIFPNPAPTANTNLTAQMRSKEIVLNHPELKPSVKPDWLTWNYTINASNYQIIVLDTRNWRSYPGPTGNSPPQLLSDAAWTAQVIGGSAPPVGTFPELTFVVSPAVPLGIPVVEFLQEKSLIWSKYILDNDVEGWTSQSRSFQLFLSKLATRPLGIQEASPRQRRIVVLSGDVHHAFAVRLQYWATKPYESDATNSHTIFALFTASSFKNQDWNTEVLHNRGYEALYVANKRDWINYFGWGNSPKSGSFQVRCKEREEEEHPPDDYSFWSAWPKPLRSSEWRYCVHYLDSVTAKVVPIKKINEPGKTSVSMAQKQHNQYFASQGPGLQIVGINNIGEITFKFDDDDTNKMRIGQRLWWSKSEPSSELNKTFHVVSLDFDDPDYKDPNTLVGSE